MKAIVLIGEMGSGKSYRGRLLAEELGYEFLEGDDFAGPEMKEAIAGFKLISKKMILELTNNLALAIVGSMKEGVVVSQALYNQQNRDYLCSLLAIADVEVEFVWVKVGLWQNVKQLLSRPKGLRWIIYWLLSKPFFQAPKGARLLLNERST